MTGVALAAAGRRLRSRKKKPCRLCGYPKGVDRRRRTCDDCARREGTLTGGAPPELPLFRALSLHVIKQAVADVATHVARHKQTEEQRIYSAGASDFLMRRLWEPGVLWAELVADLLHAGMREDCLRYVSGLQVRRTKNRWKHINRGLPTAWRTRAGAGAADDPPVVVDDPLEAEG